MIKVIWPVRITLTNWAAALTADFPSEGLPKLEDEDNWQEWGNIVANSGIFLRASVPMPTVVKKGEIKENFSEWEKWAKVVYTIMADEYNIPKIISR